MFLGEYQHTIDTKGRLAIPSRFRSKLEHGAVLVRGIETCLYVFPMETWEEKAKELDKVTLDPKQRRLIERRFFGTAYECELDAQGRIVVPSAFRRYAELVGESAIIGARHRFEIWNLAKWESYQDEMANEDLTGIDLPF
jgi:MraZ protein